MMSRIYLLSCAMLWMCVTLASSSSEPRNTYQLSERKALTHPRRANEETLTFSGDIDKILEMANNRARDRAEAEAAAAANDSTINVDDNGNDGTAGNTDGNNGDDIDETPTLEAATTPPKGIDDGSEHGESTEINHTLCPTDTSKTPESAPTVTAPTEPAPIVSTPTDPAPTSVSESITVLPAGTKAPVVAPVAAPVSAPTVDTTEATSTPTESPETAIDTPEETPSTPTSGSSPTPESSQGNSGWFPIPAATKAPISSPVSSPESIELTPPTAQGSELPVVTDEYNPTSPAPNSPTTPGGGNVSPPTTGVPASTLSPAATPTDTPNGVNDNTEGGDAPGSSPTTTTGASSPSSASPSTPTVGGNGDSPSSSTSASPNTPTVGGNGDSPSSSTSASPNTPTAGANGDSPSTPSSTSPNTPTSGGNGDSPSSSTSASPNTPTAGGNGDSPSTSSSASPNTPTAGGNGDSPSSSTSASPNTPTAGGNGDSPSTSSSASPNTPTAGGNGDSPTSASPNTPTVGGNGDGPSTSSSASPNTPTAGENGDSPLTSSSASPNTPTVGGNGESPSSSVNTPTVAGNGDSSPKPTFSSPVPSPAMSPTSNSPFASSTGNSPTPIDGESESNGEGGSSSSAPATNVPIGEESDTNPESSPSVSVESLTPASSPSVAGPAGDKSPVEPEDTVIACDESTLDRPETIEFTYSLETAKSDFSVVESIRKSTEQTLSKDIANLLLPCGVRRLQSGNALGFEGIDHKPEDSISTSANCDPDVDIENDCSVVDGILTVYISQQTDFELAKYYTLTAIREALGLVNGQVTGLVKATYLGPDIVNPAEFNVNGIEADDIAQDPNNLNTSLVLFAVGGCAFAASVGLIYYLRRHGNSSSGGATQAAGSDQETGLSGHDHPLSPFSEMLPSAYRFDQDGQMSAILELDDESATQRSGIAISDSGFTTDEEGSIAISAISSLGDSVSVTQRTVLGARKRQDQSMDSLLELL